MSQHLGCFCGSPNFSAFPLMTTGMKVLVPLVDFRTLSALHSDVPHVLLRTRRITCPQILPPRPRPLFTRSFSPLFQRPGAAPTASPCPYCKAGTAKALHKSVSLVRHRAGRQNPWLWGFRNFTNIFTAVKSLEPFWEWCGKNNHLAEKGFHFNLRPPPFFFFVPRSIPHQQYCWDSRQVFF